MNSVDPYKIIKDAYLKPQTTFVLFENLNKWKAYQNRYIPDIHYDIEFINDYCQTVKTLKETIHFFIPEWKRLIGYRPDRIIMIGEFREQIHNICDIISRNAGGIIIRVQV